MISSCHFSTIPSPCNLVPWLWRWVIQQFRGTSELPQDQSAEEHTEDCLEGMLGLLGTPFKMKRAPMDKNCLSNNKSNLPTSIFMSYVSFSRTYQLHPLESLQHLFPLRRAGLIHSLWEFNHGYGSQEMMVWHG